MRGARRWSLALLVAAGATLAMAPAASAATQVGSDCTANEISSPNDYTITQLQAAPDNALPLKAAADGVLTDWTVRVADGLSPTPVPQYLKVVRNLGPGQFVVTGESEGRPVGSGANVFQTRLPIKAGEQLALFGNEGVYLCITPFAADGMFALNRNLLVGQTATFAAGEKNRIPLFATVEPDLDGDGYGDDTQDRCPQLPTVHDLPCPALTLSFFSLATRGAILVYVSAGVQSKITVSAKVGGKLKLKPVEHLADPGQIRKYKLPLTAALKKRLAATPRDETLGLKVTASGTNAVGVVKSETRTLRLKGRGRG